MVSQSQVPQIEKKINLDSSLLALIYSIHISEELGKRTRRKETRIRDNIKTCTVTDHHVVLSGSEVPGGTLIGTALAQESATEASGKLRLTQRLPHSPCHRQPLVHGALFETSTNP